MKKVYIFYIATSSCLFLALFAVFALAGLGGAPQSLEAPLSPAAPISTSPPVIEIAGLDYPDLETGVMYSVSHPTTISTDPEGIIGEDEELPPGGVFLLEGRDETIEELWYRITVNNGFEDYLMYLKAENLNRQIVTPVQAENAGALTSKEERIAQLLEAFRPRSEAVPPPPPEPEPTASEQVMASLRGAIKTVSSQGLMTALFAALFITVATIATIAVLVWLHNTRRWHKSSLFDEIPQERGEEFYEDTTDDARADER